MSEEVKPVTAAEVDAVLHPEQDTETVTVGKKSVSVRPLNRRWQSLFFKHALPMFEADLRPAEMILKALSDGSIVYQNTGKELVAAEIEADGYLDRAAAIVIASQVPHAEQDPEKSIQEQVLWLLDNSTTEEMRALVEKQAEKERLVARVGERLPAKFVTLFGFAGENGTAMLDSLKLLSNNFVQKLREAITAGNLT